MKSKIATHEDRLAVWFLWATYALQDMPHMKRRMGFTAPQEMTSWEAMRALSDKKRRPRAKLKPAEVALMIDVGDWLMEQRAVESENAATLVSLLNAASIFAHSHGDTQHSQVKEIYAYIAEEFGCMPPSIGELPNSRGMGWELLDRAEVMRICDGLMREPEVVPDWYFNRKKAPAPAADAPPDEERVVPETGDLFDE